MLQWQNELLLAILDFLGNKDQGGVLAVVSRHFEQLVMTCQQFLDVALVQDAEALPADFLLSLSLIDPSLHSNLDLGRRGKHEGVRLIEATVQIGAAQTKVGLTLVDLASLVNCDFHEACGSDMYGMYEVKKAGVAFCNRRGRYRLACVETASGFPKPDSFLVIQQLHHMKIPKKIENLQETDFEQWKKEIDQHIFKERAQSRVPSKMIAMALRKLLQHTALAGRWSVAVYEAKSESDTRAFLQAGFKQATDLVRRGDGNFVFAVPQFLDSPLLSSQVTDSMQIAKRPEMPSSLSWPSGADESLSNAVTMATVRLLFGQQTNFEMLDATFVQLIAQGASVERAFSLQHCAEEGNPELLAFCLRFAEPLLSAVNAFDPRGRTPLMCAVRSNADPEKMEACVSKLIEAGADLNLTDAAGLTALGHLWRKARKDLELDGRAQRVVHAFRSCDILEDTITPANGPTDADAAFSNCLGVDSESDEADEEEDVDSGSDDEL